MIQELHGNVLDHLQDDTTKKTVILHICNDIGKFKKGFALDLSKKYPKVRTSYTNWYKSKKGFSLGAVQPVKLDENLYVINMIAQNGFRTKSNPVAIRYDALETCIKNIKQKHGWIFKDSRIIMPRIGTGLGGGDWIKIKEIIEKELSWIPITMYDKSHAYEMNLIKQIPIIEYAASIGFTPVKKGKRYYSLQEHDSVMIKVDKNTFVRYSKSNVGGNIINFVMEFEGLSYEDAVLKLRKEIGLNPNFQPKRLMKLKEYLDNLPKNDQNIDLVLPKKGITNKHVYAYLKNERKINTEIIESFLNNGYLYEDIRRNCVFNTKDSQGKPNFISLRSTGTKKFVMDVPGCDYKECFFIKGKENNVLFVSEAIIDMMSLMCMVKDQENINWLSLNGVEKIDAIFHHLNKHPDFSHVYLGFDNDEAGKSAAKKVEVMLKNTEWNGKVHTFIPVAAKDWNDHLVKVRLNQAKEIDVTLKEEKEMIFKKDSLDLCVKYLITARENGENLKIIFEDTPLYSKDVIVGDKQATLDKMYMLVKGTSRDDYIINTDVRTLPKKVYDAPEKWTLDSCIQKLITHRKNCENVEIHFEGYILNSSDVFVNNEKETINFFYHKVRGDSKSNFDMKMDRLRKENLQSVHDAIKRCEKNRDLYNTSSNCMHKQYDEFTHDVN